ncbi:protein of unknown function [Magnetospira sp. QH-2]|nr:protein of unknown function [Magnetospira sp. QH-2]
MRPFGPWSRIDAGLVTAKQAPGFVVFPIPPFRPNVIFPAAHPPLSPRDSKPQTRPANPEYTFETFLRLASETPDVNRAMMSHAYMNGGPEDPLGVRARSATTRYDPPMPTGRGRPFHGAIPPKAGIPARRQIVGVGRRR